MALLPKRPYINLERACKELDCDIADLIDCWLLKEIDFYYLLEGEKISINYLCDYGGLGKKTFEYTTHFYNDYLTQLYNVRVHSGGNSKV